MNKRLALINQNTLESLGERDIPNIIEKFTKTGMQVLSADFGFMFWKPDGKSSYQIIYTSPETPYKPKLPRKRGYNYTAAIKRVPYFITNPKKDLLPYMKSLAIIPIFYKNHQYGNIVLCFKKKRIFTADERPLIMTLGNSAAQVLTIHLNHRKSEKDYISLLQQKNQFFDIVSHELKTPITTIKGYSQILLENSRKIDSITRNFLKKINSQSDKLTHLIQDLLDVSHIENRKMLFDYSSFELENLIKQTLDGLKIVLRSRHISFKSSKKFWVRGDSHRIEEVIINLVTNAAKYSPPDTKIKIRLTEKESKALVEVEDYGYGISEKDKNKVFERFYQSKGSNKRNLSGLGLGLFISNSIIKHHGGAIDFKSKRPKGGTIFYFTLPYYKKVNN